jgi:hypothetical protein
MTYLAKRSGVALELPRDAGEVVAACTKWSSDPGAEDAAAEALLESNNWTPPTDS